MKEQSKYVQISYSGGILQLLFIISGIFVINYYDTGYNWYWFVFALIALSIPIGCVTVKVWAESKNTYSTEQVKAANVRLGKYIMFYWLLDLFYMACFNQWLVLQFVFGGLAMLIVFYSLTVAFLSEIKTNKWLHDRVRGTERTGVLITKESARFKPLGIHVLPSGDDNAVHWFLEDKLDTRSSNYLEDAATEIQVQGLELDYTCLLWDADMRCDNGKWRYYRFNGQTKWLEQTGNTESKQEQIKYMLNAYRVLLTRARAGMVICVPLGNLNKNVSGFWEDSTRVPEYYDGTYEYLKSLGIEEI